MVGIVKEICIFMIIAQAILFFVPGSSYMKYVRILVGIIIIMRITEPVFAVFPGGFPKEGKKQEIQNAIAVLEDSIQSESQKLVTADQEAEIYKNIEEELLSRLNTCESSYEAVNVDIGEKVVITVAPKGDKEQAGIQIAPVRVGEKRAGKTENIPAEKREKEEELKELYGSCMEVDGNRIEIIME